MSLAPSEEHELNAIESRLRRSDPGLEAMFAVFSRQAFCRQGPVSEILTPRRPSSGRASSSGRAFRIAALAILACLLAASIAFSIVLTAHGGPPHGAPATGSRMAAFPPGIP